VAWLAALLPVSVTSVVWVLSIVTPRSCTSASSSAAGALPGPCVGSMLLPGTYEVVVPRLLVDW
jgi:hypothetical protein